MNKPLREVISGMDRTPKWICGSCADHFAHIHKCQPQRAQQWFPLVIGNDWKMGECPTCAHRKAFDKAFDSER